MKPEIEKIRTTLQTLLERLGFSVPVDHIEYPDTVYFSIHTKDSGLLIGEAGERLRALNHVVHKMIERDMPDAPKFFIDVNDYQKQKTEELKDTARLSAQRVRYFKKEVAMPPMSAYERRIVHATLAEYPDITTKSEGEGGARRVFIRPLTS
ncbi:MAG: hypothetical protein HYS44_02280 [Candidatus Niyogibacteria bacterium]|nr:hypothetical protein [Candidatus Niyogibacteria bacterium]